MFGFKIVKAEKVEERQEDYTEAALIAAQATLSGGGSVDIRNTAAVATASGLYARCLSLTTIEPSRLQKTLNSRILYDIGRALIEDGEAVYRIVINGGRIALERACAWKITGSASQWFYNLEIPTPAPNGKNRSYVSSAEGVFHPRINTSKCSPWKGRGANEIAGQTANLLASLEKMMSNELSKGSGYVIPIPQASPKQLTTLSNQIKLLKGGSSLVPSSVAQADTGNSINWKSQRIGADFPATFIALRSEIYETILNSLGLPKALFGAGSTRDSMRQFLHSALSPVLEQIKIEAQEKLDEGISFSLSKLYASDITGRARAFGSMVKGGMEISKAAELSGLLSDDDDGNKQ